MRLRKMSVFVSCMTMSIVLSSCGKAKNDQRQSSQASPTQLPDPSASPAASPTPNWQAAYVDWTSGYVDEHHCGQGRISVSNDQVIQRDDCGRKTSAQISNSDFLNFQVVIEPVLASIDQPQKCLKESLMDATRAASVVDRAGNTVQIYSFNQKAKCFRGDLADVEALSAEIGHLSASYLSNHQ